jgi:hypothetical protein
MASGFASGKFAIAICDRCGQMYKLNDLIKEWTGFKVCSECYEPKHPQLEPKRNIGDAIAVKEPRPSARENMDVPAGGPGNTAWDSIGMQPAPLAAPCTGAGLVGTVRIVIT